MSIVDLPFCGGINEVGGNKIGLDDGDEMVKKTPGQALRQL